MEDNIDQPNMDSRIKPPDVFLSYCSKNDNIANEIDLVFQKNGIMLRRDKREIVYMKSIKDFMNSINKSDFVVMIFSDEYLKSEGCMYEVNEVLNTHEFEKRI